MNKMVDGIRSLLRRYNYLFGLLSFVLYSFSYLIGTEETSDHFLVLTKAGLIFVSSLLYMASCNETCSNKIKESFSLLSFVVLIYEIFLLISVGKILVYTKAYAWILNSIMWTMSALISLFRFRFHFLSFFKKVFSNRRTIILIVSATITSAVVILLSAEPTGVRFSWDSDTFYGFIYSLDYDSLYDGRQLMFMKVHPSIIHAYLLVFLKLLFGDIRLAFFALNAVCIVISSFGMTFLFEALVPGKKLSCYILANALFMFSPWICGMSTFYYSDYYIYCLFPAFVYFYYKKDWIGFFSIGVLITFTRVTGLVVFGGICLGILIVDIVSIVKDHSQKWSDSLVGVLKNWKYWYFLSVAIVFLLFYLLGRDTNRPYGDTSFGFELENTLFLFKQFFTINFLWMFALLSFLCFIIIRRNKRLRDLQLTIFVLWFADFLFFLFYCYAKTVHLPRYMDSHIPTLYICGTLTFLAMKDDIKAYILMGAICVVSFIGSFRMIDPVSLLLFHRMNIGDHYIVNFEMGEQNFLYDAIICNREYYSYEILLGKALTYVISDRNEDDEIMFSLGDNIISWGYSGGRYSYAYRDGKHYFELFYDKTIRGLANGYAWEYNDSPNFIPFSMHYIYPNETIKSALSDSNANTFFYIYMPTLNMGKEEEIINHYVVLSEEEFEVRGWRMNCIKFVKEIASQGQGIN